MPKQRLQKLKELRNDLAAGVRLAIESKQTALQRSGKSDVWVDISTADLICLTSTRPNRVASPTRRRSPLLRIKRAMPSGDNCCSTSVSAY